MIVERPIGGEWEGVIGFSASTPLGIEPTCYANGSVIPARDYVDAFPGLRTNNSQRNETLFREDETEKDTAYWTRIAEIALPRFSQGITDEALNIRFRELAQTGYDVRGYSTKNKDEKFRRLQEIKTQIRENARDYGISDVVYVIEARNVRIKSDDENPWLA